MKHPDWPRIYAKHGVKIIAHTQNKHHKFTLEAPDGRRMQHIAPVSPSCPFAVTKNEAAVKRFIRNQPCS